MRREALGVRGAEARGRWLQSSAPLRPCAPAPLRCTVYLGLGLIFGVGGCGAGVVPPGPLAERLPHNGGGAVERAALLPVVADAVDAPKDMPAEKLRELVAAGLDACAAEAPEALVGPRAFDGALGSEGTDLRMEVGGRLLGGSGGRPRWPFAQRTTDRLGVRYLIVPVWLRVGGVTDSYQLQGGGAGRRRDRSITLQAELWDGRTGERVAVTSSGGMSFEFEGGVGYSAVWLPIDSQHTLQAAVRDACTDVVVRLLRR